MKTLPDMTTHSQVLVKMVIITHIYRHCSGCFTCIQHFQYFFIVIVFPARALVLNLLNVSTL